MPSLPTTLALRLALAAVIAYALWKLMGPVGLALSSVVFAGLLARPLIDLASSLRHAAKARALADVEGRYYAYHGVPLRVIEDERHHRWIALDDLRQLMPSLPRSAVLQRLHPGGVEGRPRFAVDAIDADALLAYLGRSTDASSVSLRNWLARDVVRPAAALRTRLGIRDGEPPAVS